MLHHRFTPKSVLLKERWSLVCIALAECFINLVVFLIHWRRLCLRFRNTLSDVLIRRLVLVAVIELLVWLTIRVLEASTWLIVLLAQLIKLLTHSAHAHAQLLILLLALPWLIQRLIGVDLLLFFIIDFCSLLKTIGLWTQTCI